MNYGPYKNWIWRDEEIPPRPVVIVDVDGVVSDGSHRQHFLQGDNRDWTGFFEACDEDTPLLNQIALVNAIEKDVAVILLTARPHYLLDKTLTWLASVDLRWDALILRDKRDGNLRSPQFKQRSVRQLRKHDYTPLVAFDDDMRNVEMFHAEDVPAVYIHSGYYEV